MIHPSYVELMKVLNDDVVIGEEPVVNSRYSIVSAAAKRARQLIDGADSFLEDRQVYGRKPLSIAVQELSDGHLKILTAEEASQEEGRLAELKQKNQEIRALVEEKRAREEDEEFDQGDADEGDDAADDTLAIDTDEEPLDVRAEDAPADDDEGVEDPDEQDA